MTTTAVGLANKVIFTTDAPQNDSITLPITNAYARGVQSDMLGKRLQDKQLTNGIHKRLKLDHEANSNILFTEKERDRITTAYKRVMQLNTNGITEPKKKLRELLIAKQKASKTRQEPNQRSEVLPAVPSLSAEEIQKITPEALEKLYGIPTLIREKLAVIRQASMSGNKCNQNDLFQIIKELCHFRENRIDELCLLLGRLKITLLGNLYELLDRSEDLQLCNTELSINSQNQHFKYTAHIQILPFTTERTKKIHSPLYQKFHSAVPITKPIDTSSSRVSSVATRGIQSAVQPLKLPNVLVATSETLAEMTAEQCEEFYNLPREVRNRLSQYRSEFRSNPVLTFDFIKELCGLRNFNCTELGFLLNRQYSTILTYIGKLLNEEPQNEMAFLACNPRLPINDLEQRFKCQQMMSISAVVMTFEKMEEELNLPEELRLRLSYLRLPQSASSMWHSINIENVIKEICKHNDMSAFMLSYLLDRNEASVLGFIYEMLKKTDPEIQLCDPTLSIISPDQRFRYVESSSPANRHSPANMMIKFKL